MARGNENDAVLEELGLTFEDAGLSLARVFLRVTGNSPEEADPEDAAWVAVAVRAAAMFRDADEAEITLSFSQFGQMLRRAYARGRDSDDDDLPGFDTVPKVVQVAWLAVARHASNLFNMEQAEARKLESHEGAIVDWAKMQLTPEGTP